MFEAAFDEDWPFYFGRLDNETKKRVTKKINKILAHPQKRHLKMNADFFVDEVGQHRILYRVFEIQSRVKFYFVGNHKEYEKWYRGFFFEFQLSA